MFTTLFNRRKIPVTDIFYGHFIDVKVFYVLKFDELPCISYISNIDGTKAYAHVRETLGSEIRSTLQDCYFDNKDKMMVFNDTIIQLTKRRVIEVTPVFFQILHPLSEMKFAESLVREIASVAPAGGAKLFERTKVIGFGKEPEPN